MVPLQLRYNFGKYLGAGVGTLFSIDLYDKQIDGLKYNLTTAQGTTLNLDIIANEIKSKFSDFRAAAFADLQVGLVHVGPSIGFRYLYDPKTSNSRMVSYVTWKF